MAPTVKNTKATATPRQASAKKEKKAAEPAKPSPAARKKIELVAAPEIAKTVKAATKPRVVAAKKEKVVAISQPKVVSRETVAQLAYWYWVERGYQHGHALEDWIRAERELLERAS